MEQAKPETEQATGNDPKAKPESKGSDHAPNGDGKWTSFVLGSESQTPQSQDQVESPREGSLTKAASSGARKSVHWSPELVRESSTVSSPHGSNNNTYYVPPSPSDQSSSSINVKGIPLFLSRSLSLSIRIRMYVCMCVLYVYVYELRIFVWFGRADTMNSVRNVLGRWGKKVGEATKKAEDLAGNTWQHCKFFTIL